MDTTIVIATFGRAALLQETLKSLERSLAAGQKGAEVLVVASPADEPTVRAMESLSEMSMRWRLVLEAVPGLSAARNRGIRESTSEFVVFLDDDVEVEPAWLDALMEPFQSESTEVVGGRVLPHGVPMPDWLPSKMEGLFSVFDRGEVAHEVPTVLGCNFAVRRRAFDRYGLFDVGLGRRGRVLLGNEENDFCRRVKRSGGRIRYSPRALVYHKVADRMTEEFALKMAYSMGFSNALMHRRDSVPRRVLWLARESAKVVLSVPFALVPGGSRRRQVAWAVRRAVGLGYVKATFARHGSTTGSLPGDPASRDARLSP